jgi:hypothetical protein
LPAEPQSEIHNPQSFVPQRLHRIRLRGFDRLRAHSQKRDRQRQPARQRKHPPADLDSISKILQPFVHRVVCHWPGDDIGQQNQLDKILREQCHNVAQTRAEHFANADLFGAPFDGISRQPELSETSDENRQGREDAEDLSGALLGAIQRVEILIEKRELERLLRRERFPS